MRTARAQLWVATGEGRRAMREIADLERDGRLSDKIRGLLAQLRVRAEAEG